MKTFFINKGLTPVFGHHVVMYSHISSPSEMSPDWCLYSRKVGCNDVEGKESVINYVCIVVKCHALVTFVLDSGYTSSHPVLSLWNIKKHFD